MDGVDCTQRARASYWRWHQHRRANSGISARINAQRRATTGEQNGMDGAMHNASKALGAPAAARRDANSRAWHPA